MSDIVERLGAFDPSSSEAKRPYALRAAVLVVDALTEIEQLIAALDEARVPVVSVRRDDFDQLTWIADNLDRGDSIRNIDKLRAAVHRLIAGARYREARQQ